MNEVESPPIAKPSGSMAAPISHECKAHLGTKILLVLCLLPSVGAIVVAVSSGSSYRAGYGFGFLLVFFFIWGIARFVWRIAGQSNLAYNLTLIIGMLVLSFGQCGSIAARSSNARSNRVLNQQLAQFEADVHAFETRTAEARARGEAPDSADARQIVDSLDSIGKSASGDDKLAAVATAAVLKRLLTLCEPRNAAQLRFDEAGGIDAESMLTMDLIEQRLRMVDELIALQEPIRAFRFDTEVINECRTRGASQSSIRQLTNVLASDPRIEMQRELFQADYDAFAKGREIVLHLREHFGAWSIDASQDAIVFETDAQIEVYNRLLNELETITVRQNQLLKDASAGA